MNAGMKPPEIAEIMEIPTMLADLDLQSILIFLTPNIMGTGLKIVNFLIIVQGLIIKMG